MKRGVTCVPVCKVTYAPNQSESTFLIERLID